MIFLIFNILKLRKYSPLKAKKKKIYKSQTDGKEVLQWGRKIRRGHWNLLRQAMSESLMSSPTKIPRMPKTKAI